MNILKAELIKTTVSTSKNPIKIDFSLLYIPIACYLYQVILFILKEPFLTFMKFIFYYEIIIF